MHVRCPHCHNPLEVLDNASLSDIECPSCGSSFSLVGDVTATLTHRPETKTIGHFQLVRQVGIGAFGSVWQAKDTRLDRTVAIKIPRKARLDPKEAEQFLREARAAAQLKHTHIVSVHEVGREDDQVYIVSDFVEGVTLSERLTAGLLGAREAAELCSRVADALHHAHEAGVIHRDLKPSNIMLDEKGEPHVMDFGLAKRETGEITMTIEGQILGTPAYMSPEQAAGFGHKVDRRSDIYSIGVVLYELLCGETPFRGSRVMMMHQVLLEDPRSPRRVNDRIPRDLETICLKAMAKEPRQRYATARELASDLRRFLNNEAIEARPVGTVEKTWKWAKRHPAAAGLVVSSAVAALALVGVAVGFFYNARLAAAYRTTEKYLYVNRIVLAEREWSAGNVRQATRLLDDCPVEERSWEWHYLNRLCHSELRTLAAHTGEVNCVVFSPDGLLVASGGMDGTVHIWNSLTGEEVKGIETGEVISCVCFTPDSRHVVTGEWNTDTAKQTEVRFWDLETGRQTRALRGHANSVFGLVLSQNGDMLASAGADGTIRLWGPSGHDVQAVLRADGEPFSHLALSPDGRLLAGATGESDMFAAAVRPGVVHVWDVETTDRVYTLHGHAGPINSVAFSPDGSKIVTSSWDMTVKIWDVKSGDELRTMLGHTDKVLHADFSSDGRLIATAGNAGAIRVWDADTGTLLRTLRGHTGAVQRIHFSPIASQLVSAGNDGLVKIWDAATDADSQRIRLTDALATHVSYSPDGRKIAASSVDGTMRVLDAITGQAIVSLHGHSLRVWTLAFSADGRRLASASEDKTAKIWDAATGKEQLSLEGHGKWVQCVAFSPDGLRVATASGDLTAKMWDARTGRELVSCVGHEGRVWSVAFSPDGRHLVTAAGDNTVRVWESDTGTMVAALSGHKDEVTSAVFGPYGRLIASGSQDQTIKVWDTTTWKGLFTLYGHMSYVYGVAFSPDGQRLASASYDQTVKVWDLSMGHELLTLRADAGGFHSVAFSPGGRQIAASGYDGTIRIWDATPLTKK